MVKAQVPVGGRGKAGGVVRVTRRQDVAAAVERMLGGRLKGHQVDACLIEQAVGGEERYLAVMVDAANYGAAGDLFRARAALRSNGPVSRHRARLRAACRRGRRGARRN